MMDAPLPSPRGRFSDYYALPRPPWDIGRPQRAFVEHADAIGEIPERFDAVTDCGLFHSFDDASRAAYVAALARLLEPGGRVFLLCFSDSEPGTHGPRRISAAELRHAFARGWEIESLEPARFEIVPGIPGLEFTPAGSHAWFVVLRRIRDSADALA